MTQEMKDFQKDLKGRSNEYLIKMILAMVDKDSPSFEDDSVKQMFAGQMRMINEYKDIALDLKSELKESISISKHLHIENEELKLTIDNITNPLNRIN